MAFPGYATIALDAAALPRDIDPPLRFRYQNIRNIVSNLLQWGYLVSLQRGPEGGGRALAHTRWLAHRSKTCNARSRSLSTRSGREIALMPCSPSALVSQTHMTPEKSLKSQTHMTPESLVSHAPRGGWCHMCPGGRCHMRHSNSNQ